ncbi:MAG: glycosyltransferase [Deltaproteobacteria bacterium]|nr:glycosyltransferase [Deltaproteobacteria bacterium]
MGRMKRILLFLPDLIGGGAQRTAINIATHLDSKKWDPLLVLGDRKGPYTSLLKPGLSTVDLQCERVRSALRPLARAIRAHRPDLLFAPYPDADAALALARAFARYPCPLVLRESNFRSIKGGSWGNLKNRLIRWSYHRADRVVALSDGVREDLIRRYGLQENRVVTIYNPVELDRIAAMADQGVPEPLFAPPGMEDHLTVIGVGRLVHQKGFDLLIRAVASLKDLRVRLILLGEGRARDELLQLAREMGVAERVMIPGFQDNPYAWMRKADLFVLSSRWEGFGHVIVEAMASGVCVLAARCPSGPEEIITDGVDGRLCAPDSVEDLARSIDHLLKRPEERARMADEARRAAARFDAKSIVRRYEAVFEEALAGSHRPFSPPS